MFQQKKWEWDSLSPWARGGLMMRTSLMVMATAASIEQADAHLSVGDRRPGDRRETSAPESNDYSMSERRAVDLEGVGHGHLARVIPQQTCLQHGVSCHAFNILSLHANLA